MKDLKIYLSVAAVLLVIYIVVQFNKPQATDWSASYINTQKAPFGTYILYNQIKDVFPKAAISPRRQPPFEVLDDKQKRTAYIIICNRVQFSEIEYDLIKNYVSAGNDMFIAAEDFGTLLKDNLNIKSNDFFGEYNKTEYVSFVNPALNPERQYYVDKQAVDSYFAELDTAKTIVLGVNNDGLANFIQYKMGKGSLFLAANPKLFTNYSLLKPQAAQYAPTALAYLKNPKEVIWDEYYSQGSANEGSPMRVFFNNPALRWAYYIALVSMLIYVVYGIKRRQRAIPVIEPLKNSTLDFVNVVGQVYYEQRDNQNIAEKKILYFLILLRDRYQLKTNKLDNEFITALAQKTGLETAYAKELVNYINYIAHQPHVNDYELLELNKLIEKFHTLSA
ncbi:MAG: DUF4350 domain-containing protein [Mucilaginibacter sp.]